MSALNILPATSWHPGGEGIYRDIPIEYYHRAAAGVSRSMAADLVFRSPLHMRYNIEHPDPPTGFMAFGTLVHCALLEPEKLAESYYVRPDLYPAEDGSQKPWHNGSKYCKGWNDRHADKHVIISADEDMVKGCVTALKSHPIISPMLESGHAELSVFAHIDDLLVRCRPDLMAYDADGRLWVLDIKKCQDASPAAFRSHARAMHYDFQDAWYRRVLDALGLTVHRFVFVAVEEKPPHGTAAYKVADENLSERYSDVQLAINLARQCSSDRRWPGYDTDVRTIGWRTNL